MTDTSGNVVVRVIRGISMLTSKVKVEDGSGRQLGGFNQKLFSIGGSFRVMDEMEQEVCQLVGKWTGWEFKFSSQGVDLAKVSKKWSGSGKELFTSADNYVLEIEEAVPTDSDTRRLIIAAVMCIDMVLKE